MKENCEFHTRHLFLNKYVDGIYGCTTQAFPGATIGRLSQLVSSGRVNLSSVDFIIIQIGTTCNRKCFLLHNTFNSALTLVIVFCVL
jgi:hypothetical protein